MAGTGAYRPSRACIDPVGQAMARPSLGAISAGGAMNTGKRGKDGAPGGSHIDLQIRCNQSVSGSAPRWLTAIVTVAAQALDRLGQHHLALGDVENSSTRTARKRHRTLNPHTRAMPTIASSRSAMSANTRYSIGGNLPALDGSRGVRPRLRQPTGLAAVLGRYSGMDGIKGVARYPHCLPRICTRRAHSSPRHACGLYRVPFLHHLHHATHVPDNAIEVIRKGAIYLRNPAP